MESPTFSATCKLILEVHAGLIYIHRHNLRPYLLNVCWCLKIALSWIPNEEMIDDDNDGGVA